MATTQGTLERLQENLDESIGYRQTHTRPQLSPVPSPKDIGRRPLRNVARLEADQVIPDPSQPRTDFSLESIERLAGSIRDKGQLAPIRVRWSEEDTKWIIVCGERRWRAVKAAGLDTIDCSFVDGELSEAEKLEQQMIENLLREDLSPIEQARGFSALMELHGWNGKKVAESLHVPASTVSRALALLDLPEEIQTQVDTGELAARSAYEISKLKNPSRQRELAEKAANGMTLQQTQQAVRRRTAKSRGPAKPKRLEFLSENGWRLIAIAPKETKLRTYHHLQEAIEHVTEEVQTRINSNIRIDYPTPEFICFVEDDSREPIGMIETVVRGESLDRHKDRTTLKLVARVASAVHGLSAELFPHLPANEDRSQYVTKELGKLGEELFGEFPLAIEVREWIRAHLPSADPNCVLHGDLLPQNLLCDWREPDRENASISVIDWEMAQIGDPAYDLAIVSRGNRKVLGINNGLKLLVEEYLQSGGKQIALRDVHVHELLLVLHWLEEAWKEYQKPAPSGHGPDFYVDKLRSLFRRVTG